MTTNITTLALNLLISERISHRNHLASQMIHLLDTLEDTNQKSIDTKQAFIEVIRQCISNPTCQFRDLFYRYAEYYAPLLEQRERMSSAA